MEEYKEKFESSKLKCQQLEEKLAEAIEKMSTIEKEIETCKDNSTVQIEQNDKLSEELKQEKLNQEVLQKGKDQLSIIVSFTTRQVTRSQVQTSTYEKTMFEPKNGMKRPCSTQKAHEKTLAGPNRSTRLWLDPNLMLDLNSIQNRSRWTQKFYIRADNWLVLIT